MPFPFRLPFVSSFRPRIFPEDFTATSENFNTSPWKQKLNDLRLSAEGKLQRQVDANNAYPFDEVGPKLYEFSIRYNALYYALAGLFVSMSFTVYLVVTNGYKNQFFLLPIILIVICCAAIYDYKDRRLYQLNRNILEYRFLYNDRLHVCGSYYNVYLRLRRETRSGHHRPHYYLVLNGYMIDSYRISGTTRNVDELRRLGQKIAQHLNLNYFDEGNASPLHVIRHLPPTRPVFSFSSANQNTEPVIPILKATSRDLFDKDIGTVNQSEKNEKSDVVTGNEKIAQSRVMFD